MLNFNYIIQKKFQLFRAKKAKYQKLNSPKNEGQLKLLKRLSLNQKKSY